MFLALSPLSGVLVSRIGPRWLMRDGRGPGADRDDRWPQLRQCASQRLPARDDRNERALRGGRDDHRPVERGSFAGWPQPRRPSSDRCCPLRPGAAHSTRQAGGFGKALELLAEARGQVIDQYPTRGAARVFPGAWRGHLDDAYQKTER